MVARVWLVFVFCCLLGACVEEKLVANTQLMLVADTDIADLVRIDFAISDGERERTASGEVRGTGSPRSVAILREEGPLGPVTVTARGYDADGLRVWRHAVVSFVPGQTVVVLLHLLDGCSHVECGGSATCTERGCESALIAASALRDWNGTLPVLPDNHPPLDGAVDEGDASAQPDSGVAMDAESQVDASTPEDASQDAADGASEAAADASNDAATDAGSDAGLTNCAGNGGWVDLQSNVAHCGKCNKACSGPIAPYYNIMWACQASSCVYVCQPLYGNCDGNGNNGCEKPLNDDGANCGACGFRCAVGERCNQGRCIPQ